MGFQKIFRPSHSALCSSLMSAKVMEFRSFWVATFTWTSQNMGISDLVRIVWQFHILSTLGLSYYIYIPSFYSGFSHIPMIFQFQSPFLSQGFPNSGGLFQGFYLQLAVGATQCLNAEDMTEDITEITSCIHDGILRNNLMIQTKIQSYQTYIIIDIYNMCIYITSHIWYIYIY
jgi:hypothetical protein